MSSGASKAVPPEILFAQHLASNEKVYRDRALRRLQKYLFNHSSLPNGGFNETELLKIWKGLHYCMWMQDKPLIQEELCDKISNLVHSFNNPHTALLFITTFYMTECREWTSIDKWRMDKFLMLLRNMLRQSFEFLKKTKWSDKHVRQFLGFISSYILHDHGHATSPDGVRFHLADIYLTELQKVSAGQLGPKQTVIFLEPWIGMLKGIHCKTLRAFVIKNVFGELIQQSPVMLGRPRKKGSTKLRVNYRMVADKLLETGASEECTSVNRPAIYNLVQNFRDIAEGKRPYAEEEELEEDEVEDLNDDDIESAVQRLSEFTEKIKEENQVEKLRVRKRKRGSEDADEAYGSESSDEEIVDEEMPGCGQEVVPVKDVAVSKKKKKEAKPPKTGVLSKKLKRSLQAEEEYMAEDSDTGEVLNSNTEDQLVEEEDDSSSEKVAKAPVKKMAAKKQSKLKTNKHNTKSTTADASGENVSLPETTQDTPSADVKVKSVGKRKKTKVKVAPLAPEFDVEDFPEESNESDFTPALVTPTVDDSPAEPARMNKTRSTLKAAAATPKAKVDKKSKGIAEFIREPQAKAKYFKKSMSKTSSPATPVSIDSMPKTPVTRSQTKRLSFGKNSSVKKSAVKLRGSSSYDPTRTPEQGILKVNPIEPGTVIQVGKQATLTNTLKNSKFPHRMMAADFF